MEQRSIGNRVITRSPGSPLFLRSFVSLLRLRPENNCFCCCPTVCGPALLGRAAPGRGVRGGETAKTAAVADLVSPYTPAPHRLCRPLPVKRRLGAQLRLAAATKPGPERRGRRKQNRRGLWLSDWPGHAGPDSSESPASRGGVRARRGGGAPG